MELRTRRAQRLMSVTAAQIATVALCAAVWLLSREVPRGVRHAGGWRQLLALHRPQPVAYWPNFAYLGVVCTAAIISMQTWGQSRTSANEAAVIYSFEPGAAAFFGYFWLGEAMTARGLARRGLVDLRYDCQPMECREPAGRRARPRVMTLIHRHAVC